MADTSLVDLETAIKGLPGVLGCVILTNGAGDATEVQAFIKSGVDRGATETAIHEEVRSSGMDSSLRQVLVFELEADSLFGDRESLERAAELAEQDARATGASVVLNDDPEVRFAPAPKPDAARIRPPLLRVGFSTTNWTSEAEVALGHHTGEAVGVASGDKTPHGLTVLAEAALTAVHKLTGGSRIELKGASLVNVVGQEAVLVLVEEEDGTQIVGGALVRGGPISECAVRATLDAVNRRLLEIS